MGATTLQDQKASSPIERAIKKFGAYFEERGLGAADLPAAIIVHEILGMMMASAAWAACYKFQPSRRLAGKLNSTLIKGNTQIRMQQAYNMAMTQANKMLRQGSWLNQSKMLPKVDSARLTTSLAESLCFRAAAKPATFVFKLWASFHIVRLAKQHFYGEETKKSDRKEKKRR